MIWFVLAIIVIGGIGTAIATKTLFQVIGILFLIATLVFLWGVIIFIFKSGNETERATANGMMTWGILGLAVMAAVWGITTVLVEYVFGPGQGPTRGTIPTLPGQQGTIKK